MMCQNVQSALEVLAGKDLMPENNHLSVSLESGCFQTRLEMIGDFNPLSHHDDSLKRYLEQEPPANPLLDS